MRKFILALITVLALCIPTLAQDSSTVTVDPAVQQILADLAANDGGIDPNVLELSVGQTETITVSFTSEVAFTNAALVPDAEFPGRGVFFARRDRMGSGTSGELMVEVTGKNSTNGDVLPLRLFLAVRYPGNDVYVEIGEFFVVVSE